MTQHPSILDGATPNRETDDGAAPPILPMCYNRRKSFLGPALAVRTMAAGIHPSTRMTIIACIYLHIYSVPTSQDAPSFFFPPRADRSILLLAHSATTTVLGIAPTSFFKYFVVVVVVVSFRKKKPGRGRILLREEEEDDDDVPCHPREIWAVSGPTLDTTRRTDGRTDGRT